MKCALIDRNEGIGEKKHKFFSRNIFIYENKYIHSRVETFNLNIYTHEKSS